jgi:hypothetical protein
MHVIILEQCSDLSDLIYRIKLEIMKRKKAGSSDTTDLKSFLQRKEERTSA